MNEKRKKTGPEQDERMPIRPNTGQDITRLTCSLKSIVFVCVWHTYFLPCVTFLFFIIIMYEWHSQPLN